MSLLNSDDELIETYIVARAKLPDDLAFSEFDVVIGALMSVSNASRRRAGAQSALNDSGRLDASVAQDPIVSRVRYGSDFLLVLGIVATAGTSGTVVAGAFIGFAKAAKIIQEARMVNEERLGKREDRLFKKEARLRRNLERKQALVAFREAERTITAEAPAAEIEARIGQSTAALDQIITPDERRAIDRAIGGSRRSRSADAETYAALDALAEYNIEITQEDIL